MSEISSSELLDMELALAKSWRLLTDAVPPTIERADVNPVWLRYLDALDSVTQALSAVRIMQ